jgi:Ubiquitin-conjugating enzyme
MRLLQRRVVLQGYPNRPPKVKFTGPMYHPNVYQVGGAPVPSSSCVPHWLW